MSTLLERKIVQINEEKCNGCGICIDACHEGAIQMVDGKAKLVSDIYCDGLGDCLQPCPTGAISIITRSAEAYDEEAVQQRMEEIKTAKTAPSPCIGHAPDVSAASALPCGCPGMMSRSLKSPAPIGVATPGMMNQSRSPIAFPANTSPAPVNLAATPGMAAAPVSAAASTGNTEPVESELMNWPLQLRLIPPSAPYLRGADILLAADCTPVAVPNFHQRYLKNKPVILACPKLEDNEPQIHKLAQMVAAARPASITVLRMEVPCCGGLVRVAQEAVKLAEADTRVNIVTVGINGREL